MGALMPFWNESIGFFLAIFFTSGNRELAERRKAEAALRSVRDSRAASFLSDIRGRMPAGGINSAQLETGSCTTARTVRHQTLRHHDGSLQASFHLLRSVPDDRSWGAGYRYQLAAIWTLDDSFMTQPHWPAQDARQLTCPPAASSVRPPCGSRDGQESTDLIQPRENPGNA